MHFISSYLKPALALTLAACGALSASASATILNFSAVLTTGTCTIGLNKSTLGLGTISFSQLRPNQLVAPQPFVLSVNNCTADASNLTPVVKITGSGALRDGKWLFRNAGSAAGTGILVIQSATLPVYGQTEVRDNTTIPLAAAGKKPVNQQHTFYAGASCGGSSGCTTLAAGKVTANLIFTFVYQ